MCKAWHKMKTSLEDIRSHRERKLKNLEGKVTNWMCRHYVIREEREVALSAKMEMEREATVQMKEIEQLRARVANFEEENRPWGYSRNPPFS